MPAKHPRIFGVASVIVLAAAMLAGLMWLWSAHARHTARQLASDLETLPDEQLRPQLRRLASLGDAGLPALCAALASPRPAVAAAAGDAMQEELCRWELLPAASSGPKLAIVARLLAHQASLPDGGDRSYLADLAERLLTWPQADVLLTPQITADCHQILDALADAPSPRLLVAHTASAPLRRLPAEAVRVALQTGEDAPHGATADFVAPASMPDETRPAAASATPAAAPPPALLPAEVSEARPLGGAALEIKPMVGIPVAEVTNVPSQQSAVPLAELNTLPLAQLLHSPDPTLSKSAHLELERRGHAPLEIYLMDALTDADPAKRSRAAASLLGVAGMDARPWLLWLSRDQDAAVRLAALTLMATSGESQMLGRIREMAQSDADAGVRAQAQRVAR